MRLTAPAVCCLFPPTHVAQGVCPHTLVNGMFMHHGLPPSSAFMPAACTTHDLHAPHLLASTGMQPACKGCCCVQIRDVPRFLSVIRLVSRFPSSRCGASLPLLSETMQAVASGLGSQHDPWPLACFPGSFKACVTCMCRLHGGVRCISLYAYPCSRMARMHCRNGQCAVQALWLRTIIHQDTRTWVGNSKPRLLHLRW